MKYLHRFLVLIVLLAWTGSSQAQSVNKDHYRNSAKIVEVFRSVVANASDATVRVTANGKNVAFGTIVDPDGWIVTKWSEIEANRDKVSVKLKDGRVFKAEVRGVKDEDPTGAYDLAILKIDAKGLPTVQWDSSKEATVGRWVASVGNAKDPIAIGVVSVAARKFKQNDQQPKFLNTDGGYLGVGLEQGEGGAKVNAVSPKSPAERAGLMVNDIVYEASGRKINGPETLISTVGRMKPGENVLLKVKRGELDIDFRITLAVRPKQLRGNPQETMGTKLSARRGGFPTIIQHDSGVPPEDCGGPLVDLDGKAVGINIARAGRTETYAIPAEEIQALLPELKSGKLRPKDDIATVQPLKNQDEILRVAARLTNKDTASKTRVGRFAKAQEVQLQAGVVYEIEMISPDFDSYLMIEDAKGNKLTEAGKGFAKTRLIYRAPIKETYRVVASSFSQNETGSYTLIVRKQAGTQKR